MILSSTFRKVLLLAASFAALGTSFAAPAQTGQGIVAVVNEDIVTTYDLRQRMLYLIATTGVKRDEEGIQRIQSQALRSLVNEQLQIQEARKFEQTIRDEEVNRRLAQLFSRNGLTPEKVAEDLAQVGAGLGTLQSQIRADIAWQRIVRGLFASKVRISDAQIDETYAQYTANATKPSYRVGEIYLEATPELGGMEGVLVGAGELIKQMQEGAAFQLIAQQFSSAASGAKGGDVGWINQGELRPELNEALLTLEKGQLSTPIQVPGGVYIILLIDTRVSKPDTLYKLQQVRSKIDEDIGFEAAKARVNQALTLVSSCDSIKDDLDDVEDVDSFDMGELKATEMSEAILESLENVEAGQGSTVVKGPGVAASFFVCEKSLTGENIPTRNQIEETLIDKQVAQASKRHLRDLRRGAAISIR